MSSPLACSLSSSYFMYYLVLLLLAFVLVTDCLKPRAFSSVVLFGDISSVFLAKGVDGANETLLELVQKVFKMGMPAVNLQLG